MSVKEINEKNSIEFITNLLDYYSTIDSCEHTTILTSNDVLSRRNNVGWYQHVKNEHRLFLNVPNMLYLTRFIDQGLVDENAYYAFLTLCTGHEHRHFQQGRCIYEGKEIDGYGQSDVLNAEFMLYIRYFFDAYYLLNKGYVKYEEDAEKFAVIEGLKFFKKAFPDIDAEKAMLDAVNLYARLQANGGISSTLPQNNQIAEELIFRLNQRITDNLRVTPLNKTLFVADGRRYGLHQEFGLDENVLLTRELIDKYQHLTDGAKQDQLVAEAILHQLQKPVESLHDFPILRKTYFQK